MSTYKLTIDNYQILQHAQLLFPQGLTLITGPSNHGKSSIFKALQQLVYNTPGTNYINHNHTKTTIQFTKYATDNDTSTDDNVVYDITYSKDTKGNGQYDITDYTNILPNQQERFTKLGSSQIDPVKQLTHIDKQLNYNFWNQMDKPFMLSLTNKEQFDLLQQSPHTQTLNNVQQHMTQDRKQYDKYITQTQSQLTLIQQQNQQFTTQLINKPQIDDLYNTISQMQQHRNNITQLTTLLTQYDTIDLNKLQGLLSTLQDIPSLTTLQQTKQQLDQFTTLFNNLTRTVQPINELLNTIQQYQTQQTRVQLFTQTHFKLCPLCHQPFNNHISH